MSAPDGGSDVPSHRVSDPDATSRIQYWSPFDSAKANFSVVSCVECL